MTHDQWMQLLAPVISTVIIGVAGIAGVILTGVAGAARRYFDAKGLAAASQVTTDASARLQAAMQNAAGGLALKVQAGQLDVTDLAAVRAEATAQAEAVKAKVPAAIETLRPIEGAVAEAIAGKLGALVTAGVAPLPALPAKGVL